jgi:hypothetical protein
MQKKNKGRKNKMKKIKMLGLGALLALGTMGDVRAQEVVVPTGSVELMATQDQVGMDAKTFTAYEKLGLFSREIASVGYDGTVSDFGLTDVTYNIGSGDLVLEGQYSVSGGWFSPRAGIQGYTSVGPVDLYGLATVEIGDLESPALLEVLGTVSHSQDLGKVDLNSSLEVLVDAGVEGVSFAQEKARVGLSGEHVEGGVGVDLIEIPSEDGVSTYVGVGPYMKVSF